MNDCTMRSLVDAHFARSVTPDEESELRAHLTKCEACHLRYRRRLVLARLDPAAPTSEDRLANGLGLGARRGGRPWIRAALAAAGGLAMAAALVLAIRPTSTDGDGFTARGPALDEPASHVRVFHAPRGGVPALAEGEVRRDDELAFAYENATTSDRLMIFGLDEHGHVYWYHPAWIDGSADPGAVRVLTDGARHELREAVVHDLDGETLEIHALFLDHEATVKEVERHVSDKRAPAGSLALPGASDHVLVFRVTP